MDDLRAAIEAADWALALGEALALWRETRAPELAALVDELGSRCLAASPPRVRTHAWWVGAAVGYEPASVTYLLSQAQLGAELSEVTKDEILARWGSANPLVGVILEDNPRWFAAISPIERLNTIDRLAAVCAWPADPRASAVLLAALASASLSMWGTAIDRVCGFLADQLAALADPRLLPRLEELAEGEGSSDVARAIAARHAGRAWAQLSARVRPPDAALEALRALIPPDPASPAPAAAADGVLPRLWAEVAEHPDEIGPRLVLADALAEIGESRGELIALQCALHTAGPSVGAEARAQAKQRVKLLLEQHWDRWLGPLAPYLHREGSAFRRGMLENIHVGLVSSPGGDWREVAGHHELCAVHTVRPHRVSPEHYALFVAGLARPPRRLVIEGPLTVQHFAAHVRTLPLESASYAHLVRRSRGGAPEARLADTLWRLALLAPALSLLAFDARCPWLELEPLLPDLHRMFPALHRVEVPDSLVRGPDQHEIRARLRALPLVQVV